MSSGEDLRHCQGLTRTGARCRAWAVRGSDTCLAHREQSQAGERRQTALDEVIDDLLEKQARLSTLLDETEGVGNLARLFALHGQNASRLGRLMRDRHFVSGQSVDGLLEVIGRALDELSAELGIEL